MTGQATALVLLSALLHAVWNFFIKREVDPRSATLALLAVAAIVAAALVPFSAHPFPTAAGAGWGAAAGAFEGIYFASLGRALARAPLGPVYTTARGGAMLVTWPLSMALLGERLPWEAGVGALLIAAGLALTALSPRERSTAGGLAWAAVCAVSIGGYHLCYKVALRGGADPRALFAVALAFALPLNVASMGPGAVRRGVVALRASPLRITLGGVACTASFVVLLQALSLSGAGAVLTLRNTSVLFALALAVLGGEKTSRRVIAGGVLVAAGALLVAR